LNDQQISSSTRVKLPFQNHNFRHCRGRALITPLGLVWQPKSPPGSRPFPGVVGPRGLLPRVGLLGHLAVAPVEICHPFSRGFSWADVPVSLGRERIPWRATCSVSTAAAAAPLPQPPQGTSAPPAASGSNSSRSTKPVPPPSFASSTHPSCPSRQRRRGASPTNGSSSTSASSPTTRPSRPRYPLLREPRHGPTLLSGLHFGSPATKASSSLWAGVRSLSLSICRISPFAQTRVTRNFHLFCPDP
jgi:hypothetical protein